jgi:hypothetical protein
MTSWQYILERWWWWQLKKYIDMAQYIISSGIDELTKPDGEKGINAFMAGSVISNLRRNMVEWREINPHLTCEEINPPHPHSIQASWELTEPDLNKLSIGFPAWPYGALAPGLVCSCGRCFRSFLSYIDTSFISKYLLFFSLFLY